MIQDEVSGIALSENVITVNPIYEDTVYINDAVVTDVEFVDAVLIIETTNRLDIKKCTECILSILFLGVGMFLLFLCFGGLGFFLTIDSGDDPT
jgi:hypothetical protein